MPTVASARSILFAPASDEHKLGKAFGCGADAVVADLEDAVPVTEKARAREVAPRVLAEAESESLKCVRINAVGTEHWEADLEALEGLALDAVVVPKATPEGVERVPRPVVAIVETAQGLRLAHETALEPNVLALVLGAVDLGLQLGLEPRADGQEILFARSKLVVDSAAAGLRAPFDAVHLQTRDDEGLAAECALARSLGFRGKACIHPAQVPVVNREFAPSEHDVERARRIVSAAEEAAGEGRGAFALEGEMIDIPIVERARQLLADAERSRLHGS
jgi:citrate lyase beta subunit